MATGRAMTAVVVGVRAHLVEVEAHLAQGLPHWAIVGLPDTAVSESRERVRAATASSGLPWPTGRITVGLSPASLPKRGSGLDLGIAVAVLTSSAVLPDRDNVADWVFVGELGLDGSVRPVGTVLPAALAAARAGAPRLVVPAAHAAEAELVTGLQVMPVWTLRQLWGELTGDDSMAHQELDVACAARRQVAPPVVSTHPAEPDLADVRGQRRARRGLEVAAAGGHHLALAGPAGVGKSLLAARLASLLPDLDDPDALEVTSIRALSETAAPPELIRRPPVVSPHHTTTDVALIGGGSAERPRIGLVTKAHAGVLLLDEAAEFSAGALDSLRQSMETGQVTLSRSGFHVELPARFQLLLTTNPCPCGRALDSSGRPCSCSSVQRRRYLARLAGPLLDRVDVRLTLRRPTLAELSGADGPAETSTVVADRVRAARQRAARRLAETTWRVNAAVPAHEIRRNWPVPDALQRALSQAAESQESVRGLDLALRVAWTLADLAGKDAPGPGELTEAMSLRNSEAWLA
ncbi:MAG: YifB family Mg chelatase-like AAA ATPase [Actinobacteria bacterium]|nr:YifB family Mg chelatase-like AAA ATPase [Actinomycetota bacterium]MCB9412867.1 YifB family Mg chelatase-like AAA ATPase [Actinomycetota bacterium]